MRWLACLAFLIGPAGAHAWVVEETIQVPVKVATIHGKEVERAIYVTLFVENSAPQPRPLLVLNHGRPSKPAELAKVKAKDYADAARWLTGFGFIVAVPLRVGYGQTGGEDVENSGACNNRNYPPVYRAAAVQTLAVLEALRRRPDAAKDRVVVMGQSFGGATAITLAALAPPGVQAAINLSGGGGGNPVDRPQNPCSQPALKRLFAGYGKTARMPSLWLYSENDQYFGPKLPREWFDAFKAAGGAGEYALMPPVGSNGHLMFYRAPSLWQPPVREFLVANGFAPLNSSGPKR